MAKVAADIPNNSTWTPTDRVGLLVGSEGAASLGESDPAGGELVIEQSPFPEGASLSVFGGGVFGDGEFGGAGGSVFGEGVFGDGEFGVGEDAILLYHVHAPIDVCAVLPIGVQVRDGLGNIAAAVESVLGLDDPPRGVRGVVVEATDNPLEARLRWTQSPHV